MLLRRVRLCNAVNLQENAFALARLDVAACVTSFPDLQIRCLILLFRCYSTLLSRAKDLEQAATSFMLSHFTTKRNPLYGFFRNTRTFPRHTLIRSHFLISPAWSFQMTERGGLKPRSNTPTSCHHLKTLEIVQGCATGLTPSAQSIFDFDSRESSKLVHKPCCYICDDMDDDSDQYTSLCPQFCNLTEFP